MGRRSNHLSKAVQAFVSATKLLELMCTPSAINPHPGLMAAVENNLEIMERDGLDLRRAQAALKTKRNLCISPINVLPSELLAYIFTTAVDSDPPTESTEEYVELKLSQVCSRWRQIALEACPLWCDISLRVHGHDNPAAADIALSDIYDGYRIVYLDRQHDVGDLPYAQMVFATIAPYIKQLYVIRLEASNIEQIEPFLESWLENGTPGLLAELSLSVKKTSRVFANTNSHSSDRLYQYLRHIPRLALRSVAFDWATIVFDRLEKLILGDLPSFCCPALAQLALILSNCPSLRILTLQRIVFSASPDVVTPEPVKLEHLADLTLEEVNVARMLSVISPGRCELRLELKGVVDDVDTLASFLSFAGRSNISYLTLSLPEIRSDEALGHLLHFAINSIPGQQSTRLMSMKLRDPELNALANYPLSPGRHLPPLSLVGTTRETHHMERLQLWYCTIPSSAEAFHDAISTLPWLRLTLWECKHLLAAQGEAVNAAEIIEDISTESAFGVRLNELMPGRVSII